MNLISLSWSYIRHKKLNTFLNTLLLALGVGIIVYLLLVMHQVETKLTSNAKGINLVVGAKGSPLQLILCSIFHVDNPTGNIPLKEANQLASNKQLVKKAIPLALGDSYQGFRIVGTTHAYPQHYGNKLATGNWWQQNFEVTIGSQVARQLNLSVGSTFIGSHGLAESDHAHGEYAYKVTGIMTGNGTVLDRLILTNIESVWAVHEEHGAEETHSEGEHAHEEDKPHENNGHADEVAPPGDEHAEEAATEDEHEITSLLIEFKSPMAAITMPRMINSETNMQAASPAIEIVRLFNLIGVGADVVEYFAYIIILIAGLSIFIALYNALKEREYDLAIMRTLGASKTTLFTHLISEGLLLATLGGLAGMALGHVAVALTGALLDDTSQASLTGWLFLPAELWIILGVWGVGLLAALLPALQSYRIDISRTLAR